jgi:hypothetical protein
MEDRRIVVRFHAGVTDLFFSKAFGSYSVFARDKAAGAGGYSKVDI